DANTDGGSGSDAPGQGSGTRRESSRIPGESPPDAPDRHSLGSDVPMPGRSTEGCLCSHQASTVGATSWRSSSVPALTARIPDGSTSADAIGDPQLPQKRR